MPKYMDVMLEEFGCWEKNALKDLEQNPADSDAKRLLVTVFIWRGKLDEAERLLDEVSSVYADEHYFWGVYASLKYYLGKYRESYSAYKESLKIAPTRFTPSSKWDEAAHPLQIEMYENLVKAYEETDLGENAPWLDGKKALAKHRWSRSEPYRYIYGEK